jgi:hypothetical protein
VGKKQRRERELAGEGKKGGDSWRAAASPGGHLGDQGGEQEVATPVSWEPPRTCFSKKTHTIANSPFDFGVFSGKNKTAHCFV